FPVVVHLQAGEGTHDGFGGRSNHERIAVGRALRRVLGADRAGGAGAGLDEERLLQDLREPLCHPARSQVMPTPRRVRDDHMHGFRGPVLREDRKTQKTGNTYKESHLKSATVPGAGVKPKSPRLTTASRPPFSAISSACRARARRSTSSGSQI